MKREGSFKFLLSSMKVSYATVEMYNMPDLNVQVRAILCNSLLSKVLDHQVAAYVKGNFLTNFLYILIILK